MRICIDAGHGGRDPGAVGREPRTLLEKDFNMALARLLEEGLEEAGHHLLMTRRQDRTLSLWSRAAFANRYRADLFLSIHANAAASTEVEGMEVFHFPGSTVGEATALAIMARFAEEFPEHRMRGAKSANFTVLRRTVMPAVLVECEFLTNPDQLLFLDDPCNQRRLAEAIASALGEGPE